MPDEKKDEPVIDDSGSTHEDSDDSKLDKAIKDREKPYGGFESARKGARNEVRESSDQAVEYERENVDYEEQDRPRPSRFSGVREKLSNTFKRKEPEFESNDDRIEWLTTHRHDPKKLTHADRMEVMKRKSAELESSVKLRRLAKQKSDLTRSRIDEAIKTIFPAEAGGKGKGRAGMDMFDTRKAFDQPNAFFGGGKMAGVNMRGIEAMYGIRQPRPAQTRRTYRKRKGRKGKRRDDDDDRDDRDNRRRGSSGQRQRSGGMSPQEFYGM